MNQEFVRHPTIKNYKTSRDGIVRNCRLKKPVGTVDKINTGSLRFNVGKRRYLCHRFMFECFFAEIKKGFVGDHVDGNIKNNYINNLRVITQRENCLLGKTGTCKTVGKRVVKSINLITSEEIIFQSMTAAGKHFGIWPASVRFVANGIRKSALSKKFNQNILILLFGS